jgi:molybdate transport system substrate-binding protein
MFVGTLVLAVAVLMAPGLAQAGAPPPPITVSAAVSLAEVLEEIVAAYAAAGGGAVRLNLAGSNVLARQILNGAPADVFISADEPQMDVLQRAGALAEGSRINIVANQLAIVSAPERVAFVRDRFGAAPAEIRRIAIGDPTAVPAGVYARQYLESSGLWQAYERRLVPTANVRAALAAVENGSADVAIVYVTDARIAKHAAVAFTVPSAKGPRIVYPAAVLSAASSPQEARRLLTFLAGPQAAAIFGRHGFLPFAGR